MTIHRPAILFDGDDTLWETQSIYKSVLDEFYQVLEQEGFDPQEVRSVFSQSNQHLLTTMHMSTDRLGRAMSTTYRVLLHRRNTENGGRSRRRGSITAELDRLGGEVFIRLPVPMPEVHTALATLVEDFDLYLYSGGKESTQRRRVEELGLAPYLGDRLTIVTTKDDRALQRLLAEHDLSPARTWIVGNSPRFEVNPGLRLGLHSIWMCTSFWQHDLEDISDKRTFVAFALPDVVDIVHDVMPTSVEQHVSGTETTWLVGNSPKRHINPALRQGYTPIWIPIGFTSADVEPICGQVSIAFSLEGAKRIVDRWSDRGALPYNVIWETLGEGEDRGGGIVVE